MLEEKLGKLRYLMVHPSLATSVNQRQKWVHWSTKRNVFQTSRQQQTTYRVWSIVGYNTFRLLTTDYVDLETKFRDILNLRSVALSCRTRKLGMNARRKFFQWQAVEMLKGPKRGAKRRSAERV